MQEAAHRAAQAALECRLTLCPGGGCGVQCRGLLGEFGGPVVPRSQAVGARSRALTVGSHQCDVNTATVIAASSARVVYPLEGLWL